MTDSGPPPYPPVEELCRIAHDAYEAAAAGNGWETNPASRVPWDDVPEANKATMRAAMDAVWTHVCDKYIEHRKRGMQQLADRITELSTGTQAVLAYADQLSRTADRRPHIPALDAAWAIRNAVSPGRSRAKSKATADRCPRCGEQNLTDYQPCASCQTCGDAV